MDNTDAFVGAATGTLKAISLSSNDFRNLTSLKETNPKQDEVTSMIWGNEDQCELLTAHMNRSLRLTDLSNENPTQSVIAIVDGGEGPIKGLHRTSGENLVSCVASGTVKVWSRDGKELNSFEAGLGVVGFHGNERGELVTGGENHPVKVWDIETGKKTWYAKNVPLDKLQLPVPIKCTDVKFVTGERTIVEATKVHELRLYDPRAQRKPVKRMTFMEEPITCISQCNRPNHVIAANSIGEIGLFDLRSKVNPVCKFKGQAGSIRSIDAHPTAPIFASCGIDRFVRVHDLNTRKLIHKVYCKSRLNRILLREKLSILRPVKEEWDDIKEEPDRSDEEDIDEEADTDDDVDSDDDVWSHLNVKSSAKRKESKEDDVPILRKKAKVQPIRKRKESQSEDEIVTVDEMPKNKKQKADNPVEIKEEVVSEDDEPLVKKRKFRRK